MTLIHGMVWNDIKFLQYTNHHKSRGRAFNHEIYLQYKPPPYLTFIILSKVYLHSLICPTKDNYITQERRQL